MTHVSVRAFGQTIEWQAKFREAVKDLCRKRGLPAACPSYLASVALKPQGVLVVWPEPGTGVEANVYRKHKRFLSSHPEAFSQLEICLPDGVSISVPVVSYTHPQYGDCLALHFRKATFLYRQSKITAIALQPR